MIPHPVVEQGRSKRHIDARLSGSSSRMQGDKSTSGVLVREEEGWAMWRAVSIAVLLGLLVVWPSRLDLVFRQQAEKGGPADLTEASSSGPKGAVAIFETQGAEPSRFRNGDPTHASPAREPAEAVFTDDVASWEPEFNIVTYGRSATVCSRTSFAESAAFRDASGGERLPAPKMAMGFDCFTAPWEQPPSSFGSWSSLMDITSLIVTRNARPAAFRDPNPHDVSSALPTSALRARPLVRMEAGN